MLRSSCLALDAHRGCEHRISTNNSQPLGAIHTRALERQSPESLVMFCHDDLWLGDTGLRDPLLEALQQFDLVGVAGNRRNLPGQPTWWLQPDGRSWDPPHLVGEIRHGDPLRDQPRAGPAARWRVSGGSGWHPASGRGAL